MNPPPLAPGLALLLAAACSTGAERFSRDYVSDDLQQLTGYTLGPGDGSLPPGVDPANGLDEEEAVATALWNNPTFQAALAELGLRRADLIVAGELQNPTFMILFPVDPKQLEYTARLPFDFLWQRPARVAAARFDCERTASLLVQGGIDLERDVRVAYADLRLARAQLLLARDRAEQRRQLQQFVTARFAAGDASEREQVTAQAQVLAADVAQIRAEREEALATSRIRALLGEQVSRDVELAAGEVDLSAPVSTEVAELVELAFKRRPDLRGARLAVEAAGERIGLAREEVWSVRGLGDVNGSGSSFEAGPGLDLTLPLFHQGQGATARGRAELQQAVLRYRSLQEQITFEVRDALVRLNTARRELATCEQTAPKLAEIVRFAERSWRDGHESRQAALDAGLQLLDARLQVAQARATFERARAELHRNLGGIAP